MVRSALVGALVMVLVVACARPNNTVQLAPPTPTPTPSPSPTPTAPLQATTAPFHAGEVGASYAAVALSATGGVQPYTWSISGGALPGGLSLSSDGNVTGTPTTSGSFHFTVQVADGGGSTATVPGKIGIAAHLSAGLIAACATQCSVEIGCVSVCGAFGQVSGGVGPYSYTHTSGQLPSGTSLSGLSLTGTFSGFSGYLQFSVQVTDVLGATATVAPLFWMYQHISLGGGGCQPPTFWPDGCKMKLPYGGGIPNAAVAVRVAAVNISQPAGATAYEGLTLSASGGIVYVTIPGSNRNYINGLNGTLTLVVTDHSPCGPGPVYCESAVTVAVNVSGG